MKKFKDYVAALAILEQAAADPALTQAQLEKVKHAIRLVRQFRRNAQPTRVEVRNLVRVLTEALWAVVDARK